MQIDRIFCFPRFSIKAGFAEALKREKHAPQKFDTCHWPRSYPFIPVQKINKRSISVSLSEMSFVHSPSFPSLSLARKALDRVSKEEKSLSLLPSHPSYLKRGNDESKNLLPQILTNIKCKKKTRVTITCLLVTAHSIFGTGY